MNTRQVQEHLKAIGWPISVDGAYGPRTMEAVTDFQRGYAFRSLSIDGWAGSDTWDALAHSLANGGKCGAYFAFREFASKGNGWIKVHRTLVLGLDRYRELVGGSVGIESGYRDPQHNARVGGAKNSQHLYGNAADLRPVVGVPAVRKLAHFSGIGRVGSSGLVRHVDVRHEGPANTTGGSIKAPTEWVYA